MKDPWIEKEWDDLCDRLARCAAEIDSPSDTTAKERQDAALKFASKESPDRYAELLQRVAEAAELAISWQ